MKKLFVAMAAIAALLGFVTPVVAAPDATAQPLIDPRPCGNEPVAQIRLVLAAGAVVCYGGSVGSWKVDNLYTTGMSAGGYWGFVTCIEDNRQVFFSPANFYRLDCHVAWIGITPPGWGRLAA
ncbi:hypothetical protein [Amycolatopsis sp. 195334CR]|uniref:hypothetical protein n=1 Tax=Amycolatopsis sp. 195334CR TaxID=2814588 RepID=UPI001A8F8127|nr:hypothetical protein [Amycolatopsis sp. 195334CR]MBN6034207.1 hypothetical protein [Amycolatopsis sp. 195334CR]